MSQWHTAYIRGKHKSFFFGCHHTHALTTKKKKKVFLLVIFFPHSFTLKSSISVRRISFFLSSSWAHHHQHFGRSNINVTVRTACPQLLDQWLVLITIPPGSQTEKQKREMLNTNYITDSFSHVNIFICHFHFSFFRETHLIISHLF